MLAERRARSRTQNRAGGVSNWKSGKIKTPIMVGDVLNEGNVAFQTSVIMADEGVKPYGGVPVRAIQIGMWSFQK